MGKDDMVDEKTQVNNKLQTHGRTKTAIETALRYRYKEKSNHKIYFCRGLKTSGPLEFT